MTQSISHNQASVFELPRRSPWSKKAQFTHIFLGVRELILIVRSLVWVWGSWKIPLRTIRDQNNTRDLKNTSIKGIISRMIAHGDLSHAFAGMHRSIDLASSHLHELISIRKKPVLMGSGLVALNLKVVTGLVLISQKDRLYNGSKI